MGREPKERIFDPFGLLTPGVYELEFTNGETREVDAKRVINDAHAHPIYLEDQTGKYFNWMNIISIKKVT